MSQCHFEGAIIYHIQVVSYIRLMALWLFSHLNNQRQKFGTEADII